jgi:hypothetical protein
VKLFRAIPEDSPADVTGPAREDVVRTSNGARRVEFFAFVFAAVAQAVPLLLLPYFPSEDGPSHIGSGEIIARHNGLLSEYFDLQFAPNGGSDFLAAGLILLVSPEWASRILVALSAIGMPLAARFGLSSLGPSAPALSWLMLPLSLGFFLHLGLFGFCIAVSMFFLTLGFWFRSKHNRPLSVVLLALLLTATFLVHAVPFVAALVVLVTRSAWSGAVADSRSFSVPAGVRAVFPVLVAAAVPLGVLVVYSIGHSQGSPTRFSLLHLGFLLATLSEAMVAYRQIELVGGLAITLPLLLGGLVALRRVASRGVRDGSSGLLVASIVLVVMYLVLPNSYERGVGDLSLRLSFLVWIAVALWLSQFDLGRVFRTAVPVLAIAASTFLTAVRVPIYLEFEEQLTEYVSAAAALPPDVTVVPVNLVQDNAEGIGLASTVRVRPMIQATGWLMAERHVVDLSHYEAYFDVYAIRFADGLAPFDSMSAGRPWIDQSPPQLDLLAYEQATQGRVDYVVVYGRAFAARATTDGAQTTVLDRQLDSAFELVFTSAPRGLVEVYRRKAP